MAEASGYAYVLPGAWVHLDLDPERQDASLRRATALRLRRHPALAPHQDAVTDVLREGCAVAAAAGAERVSLLAERVGERVLTAAVMFCVVDRSEPAELAVPPRGPVPGREWQHRWPWPGRALVGVLTLGSPSPPLWPVLGPVFDACVASFRWTYPATAAAGPGWGGAARAPH